ncbi:MAG TPA: hypothetical protein VJ729_07735 [Nitrososphaeraceae archaeon]|nr:hypothetical protein [Nitrososphaeraceae archaeon]
MTHTNMQDLLSLDAKMQYLKIVVNLITILVMKPLVVLVIIATVFIAGSILSPLLFLLSSTEIAYGQTPNQAPSSSSPSNFPNQGIGQRPQTPSSLSPIPGLLFPPEQQPPLQPSPLQQQPPLQQPPPQPQQPPALAPLSQTTANGAIDSLIFAPGTRWIATGNWSMVLRNGNINSFNANMTWYNNNGTGTHTHEILNFESNPIDVTVKPGENVLVKGLADVGTNHRISWKNVHSTIDIKGGKTISISLDDKETNKHFAGQAIYGVVKSFTQCSDQPGQNMEVLPPCSTSSLSPS